MTRGTLPVRNEKHVLVIGAGASCELGFPDGQKLAAKIRPMVSFSHSTFDASVERGDRHIWDALDHFERTRFIDLNLARYVAAGERIARGMPQAPSIDSFMASNAADKEVDLIGRLAIVRAILVAEAACPLHIKKNPAGPAVIDFGSVASTWLNRFWHRLANGCVVDDLAAKFRKCTLVIFNYDRCVEQFLYHAIQNYYNVKPEVAQSIMGNLAIYHPYGTVGRLPWQPNQGLTVKFGQDQINPNDLLHLAQQNIKTITEQTTTPSEEVANIQAALGEATMIVSLGFAFQPQNMKILAQSAGAEIQFGARFFATAFEMSKSDQEVVKSDLQTIRRPWRGIDSSDYNVENLTCVKLFDSYRKSLEIR
jgi:hypothetical protein